MWSTNMTLLELALDNYNKVINYHNQIGYNPNLDTIWSNNIGDIGKIVRVSTSAEDLIDNIDQTFMYAINFPPENAQNTGLWRSPDDVPYIREKQIDWLLKKQKEDGLDIFNLPIQESEYTHSRNKVTRYDKFLMMDNDKILSGNFLRTVSIAHRIFSHIGKDISSILELGAGCGHQARTLSLLLPN